MVLFTHFILLGFIYVVLGKDCLVNNVPERMDWEMQLRKDLKCEYQTFNPPSGNSTTFDVKIRFIMKYFTFNSNTQVFTVKNWVFISWTDNRLKWDPKKYGGVEETEITNIHIWTPSLVLFNSADSNDFDRFYYVRCLVKYSGEVHCMPVIVHEARCNVKFTHWPHDAQECSLEFGPWTSKWFNYKMNFSSRAITMIGADYGGEWWISDYRQEKNLTSERQLKMTFVLERESTGLAAIVVSPSVVLTALSITTLFLDVRRQVRLAVAFFSLLGHYYFLTELAQDMPKDTAEPPAILIYYRSSVILTVLIIVSTFSLDAICKLKSSPQNYILSLNGRVYESFLKYLVFPEWDVEDETIHSKRFNKDWTKFANVINSVFLFIIVIVYICLYSTLVPKPIPINY